MNNMIDLPTATYLFRYSLFKPSAMRAYREALFNERLMPDELESVNWQKTKQLPHHAYHKVPYYRSKFNAIGLCPDDITTPEHFSQVSILSRDEVIANFGILFVEIER